MIGQTGGVTMPMRRGLYATLALLSLGFSGSAWATTNLFCSGIDNDVSVQVLFGGGPILNALEATVSTGKVDITTRRDLTDQPATIVQFKGNDEEIHLDLVDSQATLVLASLRVLRFIDGETEPLQIGYVKIDSNPPAAIRCQGP